MSRTYSVNEIERMRHAVRTLCTTRELHAIEAHLQTYIFAGTSPEALEVAAKDRDAYFNALPNRDQLAAWERQKRFESTVRINEPGRAPDAPWYR